MIFLWAALGCLSDNERTPPLSETVNWWIFLAGCMCSNKDAPLTCPGQADGADARALPLLQQTADAHEEVTFAVLVVKGSEP